MAWVFLWLLLHLALCARLAPQLVFALINNEEPRMIYDKSWGCRRGGGLTRYHYRGWFLLGILPLYIRRVRVDS